MLHHNGNILTAFVSYFPDFLTLQTYSDDVDVSPRLVNTSSISFANQYYECDGNEAVLRDCSQILKQCASEQRTSLTCKGRLSFIFTQCIRQ